MYDFIFCRYEESWFPLHKRTKDCAQAAEVVSVFLCLVVDIQTLSIGF